jgi:hypothetical protein
MTPVNTNMTNLLALEQLAVCPRVDVVKLNNVLAFPDHHRLCRYVDHGRSKLVPKSRNLNIIVLHANHP